MRTAKAAPRRNQTKLQSAKRSLGGIKQLAHCVEELGFLKAI
jgi:hypothetical protein